MINGVLKLRITVALLLLWLAGLFNIERLHEPINLASFVYVLVGFLAAVIILIPKLRKVTLLEISLATLPFYATLKWALGYSFLGAQLPITVTECVVLFVTNVLAWCVAHQIDEFINIASDISIVRSFEKLLSLGEGEERLYAEVQRARRFERQLSIATISFSKEFKPDQLERLTNHAKAEIARRFLESRVASRLLELTSPGDQVVFHDGEFVMMFPESTENVIRPMLENVANELSKELCINLQIGIAEFPHEECTLTGLIERAEANARATEWGGPAVRRNSHSINDSLAPVPSGIDEFTQ